jgi:hypothetical protein
MTGWALYNRVNDVTMSATGVDAIAHTLAGFHHPLRERGQPILDFGLPILD